MTTTTSTPTIPPIGTPIYGCGFGLAFKRFFQGYVKFEGKASRSEFWWSYLGVQLIALVPAIISVVIMVIAAANFGFNLAAVSSTSDSDHILHTMLEFYGMMFLALIPVFVFALAIALPLYAAMARRLRDAGFSPWLVLLNVISLGIVPMIMCIMDTKREGMYPQPGAAYYANQPYGAGQPANAPQHVAQQPYTQQQQPPV